MTQPTSSVQAIYWHQTAMAICVHRDEDDDEDVWLPLSLVEYSSEDVTDPEKGDLVWIDGPDWLLEREGLI
jgi:hypothetical protein